MRHDPPQSVPTSSPFSFPSLQLLALHLVTLVIALMSVFVGILLQVTCSWENPCTSVVPMRTEMRCWQLGQNDGKYFAHS